MRVQGMVADEATRDLWLNSIRIGAQSIPVISELKTGPVTADSGWGSRLSGLAALLRERRLAGLRIEGDRLVLRGSVASVTERAELERAFQAQLPGGLRLDNQLAIGSPAGSAVGSIAAGSGSADTTGAPSRAGAGTSGGAAASGSATASGSAAASGSATASGRGPATTMAASGGSGGSGGAGSGRGGAVGSLAAPGTGGRPAVLAVPGTSRRPANCPRALTSLTTPIYFKTDGAELGTADRARLRRLGQCLDGNARLRVVGYADIRYTDDYNKALSERRARAVAAEIEAGGTAGGRIAVIGAGKTRGGGRVSSNEALQRARRVDIQIR
ncbi:MAG: OmpA family protein [Lautropia sp.]